jgi:hypothetical protein
MKRYNIYCEETDVRASKDGYWIKYEDVVTCLKYAQQIAVYLHKIHYSEVAQWRVSDELDVVLSQIDNMIVGLKRVKE